MKPNRRDFLHAAGTVTLGLVPGCVRYLTAASLTEDLDSRVQQHFNMAFILITKNKKERTEKLLKRMEEVKSEFSINFHHATLRRATMDTTHDTAYMEANDSLLGSADQVLVGKVVRKFYENNPDHFDFISIYNTFEKSTSIWHINAQNNIQGLGIRTYNNSKSYGSNRLLGINNMRNVNKLVAFSSIDFPFKSNSWGLLHETGHQWGCYVGDDFTGHGDLEIKQQGIHFYRGLESPINIVTPMGADHWEVNGDGTYHRENNYLTLKIYHPFQLYFMGLLPRPEYGRKFMIYNAGIVGKNFHPDSATPYKKACVWNIIEKEGERQIIG